MLCLPPRMHSLIPLFQVKVLCGTPEFVAPEVVNYDFISTGSGELVRFDLSRNEDMQSLLINVFLCPLILTHGHFIKMLEDFKFSEGFILIRAIM